MLVFDATMLLLLMRPSTTRAPIDPSTGHPVEHAESRISALVADLEKSKTRIIVPTPALSELLVKAGDAGDECVKRIQRSAVFKIASFDTLAAIEVAQMTGAALSAGNKREDAEGTWAKIKYDRQIVAIARVNRATAIYTDDNNLIAFSESRGMKAVRLADIALPPELSQDILPFNEPIVSHRIEEQI